MKNLASKKFAIGFFLAAVLVAFAAFALYYQGVTNCAYGAEAVSGAVAAQAAAAGVTTNRFVKLSAAGVITLASAGSDDIVGVCEMTATNGKITRYAQVGTITTIDSGGVIAAGNKLTSDASGKAIAVSGSTADPTSVGAIALTADSVGTGTVRAIVLPSFVGSPASLVGNAAVGGNLTVAGTSIITGAVTNSAATALQGDTTLATNKKLILREAAEYVQSDAANSLTLAAGTRIKTTLPVFSTNQAFTGIAGATSPAVNATGTVYNVTATAVITLPSVAVGCTYTFFCDGADGAVQITLSPAAADAITGQGASGVANKDLVNTAATAKRGDLITVTGGPANTWMIQKLVGTWAAEG